MISQDDFYELVRQDKVHWPENGGVPRTKIYLKDAMKNGQLANDFWGVDFGTNQRANTEIKALFSTRIFDFSKPTKMLKNITNLGLPEDGLILDFFAGFRVLIMTEANSPVKPKVLKLLPKLKTEETDGLCVA